MFLVPTWHCSFRELMITSMRCILVQSLDKVFHRANQEHFGSIKASRHRPSLEDTTPYITKNQSMLAN